HHLDMVGVVGSNPIVPTRIFFGIADDAVKSDGFANNSAPSLRSGVGALLSADSKQKKVRLRSALFLCPQFL
ncbi:hypothetical protein, partial [uncultured Sutterella sp.]|uniref:hypothetical protein n=1 Tax=uncultured Sutterella sp. TaxID=286133 RepID=UPI002607B3E5